MAPDSFASASASASASADTGSPVKTRVPVVEGMHTTEGEPHLIGAKLAGRETYFFPKHLAGGDPAVNGPQDLEEVLLSRRGRVWSYTTSNYQPPPPFVAATDPYEPITIAAVELHKEQMVILGQCVAGVTPDDLSVGTEVELVIDTLYEDDEHEYLVWKWRPVSGDQ
ncbi:MAG: OB-fold domain-containing protein [Acidimicrobiaceae bacterium]|nr:OB-fold domain-containing protein [Acidimicrobiaceae bacterium]